MGLFEHWPYTNFHNLNLDWLVSKMKTIDQDFINAQAYAQTAITKAGEAATSATRAAGSAASAAASAESAQGSASAAAASADQAASAALEAVAPINEIAEDVQQTADSMEAQMLAFISAHSGPVTDTVLYTAPNGVAYSGNFELSGLLTDYQRVKVIWKHRYNICIQEFTIESMTTANAGAYLHDTIAGGTSAQNALMEAVQLIVRQTGISNGKSQMELTGGAVYDSTGYNSGPITSDMNTGIMQIIGVKSVADQEVENIRVAYDNEVYQTAGEAVRQQVSDLWARLSIVNSAAELADMKIGNLQQLLTVNQSNVVAAINELAETMDSLQPGGGGGSVTVDSAFSTTSSNPLRNSVITTFLQTAIVPGIQYDAQTGRTWQILTVNKPNGQMQRFTIPDVDANTGLIANSNLDLATSVVQHSYKPVTSAAVYAYIQSLNAANTAY